MSFTPSTPARRLRIGLVTGLGSTLLLVGLASTAHAVTDEEIFRTLNFSVSPPGARAMGMGGATIAIADDPGAVFSNPAGLGFLDRPQAMLDFRGTVQEDTAESHPGDFSLGGLKTPASGNILLEEDGVVSPNFVGYAHPIGDEWTLAFSRHEWYSHERDSFASYTSTAFPTFENSAPGVAREALSSVGQLDMMMDVYSFAVAWAPVERVSLGVTLSGARLDVVSGVDNYSHALLDTNGNGEFDTFLKTVDYRTAIDDDDLQFTFAAGILWRPTDTLALGAVYRDGPEFELVQTIRQDGVRAADLRNYFVSLGRANANGEFITTLTVPDSYGVGLAFGPYLQSRGGGGLTIAFDAVHVEYADLLDGYVAGLNQQLFGPDSIGVTVQVEDETHFRFGIGYSWTVGYNNSIHFRAGAYTDPDHSILTAGRGGLGAQRGRDDVTHGTIGGGFTLKRGFYSFELDLAADISDLGEQYFGSALFKF